MGVPTSAVIVCASSSVRSFISFDNLFSISIRSSILLLDQIGNAFFAALTAKSTSEVSPAGTFPITCSFVGFVISILAVLFGVTHFPSIYNFSYTCIKSANVLHYLSLTKY